MLAAAAAGPSKICEFTDPEFPKIILPLRLTTLCLETLQMDLTNPVIAAFAPEGADLSMITWTAKPQMKDRGEFILPISQEFKALVSREINPNQLLSFEGVDNVAIERFDLQASNGAINLVVNLKPNIDLKSCKRIKHLLKTLGCDEIDIRDRLLREVSLTYDSARFMNADRIAFRILNISSSAQRLLQTMCYNSQISNRSLLDQMDQRELCPFFFAVSSHPSTNDFITYSPFYSKDFFRYPVTNMLIKYHKVFGTYRVSLVLRSSSEKATIDKYLSLLQIQSSSYLSRINRTTLCINESADVQKFFEALISQELTDCETREIIVAHLETLKRNQPAANFG